MQYLLFLETNDCKLDNFDPKLKMFSVPDVKLRKNILEFLYKSLINIKIEGQRIKKKVIFNVIVA